MTEACNVGQADRSEGRHREVPPYPDQRPFDAATRGQTDGIQVDIRRKVGAASLYFARHHPAGLTSPRVLRRRELAHSPKKVFLQSISKESDNERFWISVSQTG